MEMRYCRRCGVEMATYEDIITNQRAERCAGCHRRVVDGPMLSREERCVLLTSRELSADEVEPFFQGYGFFRVSRRSIAA